MGTLVDGTVYPHSIKMGDALERGAKVTASLARDYALRSGYVVGVHYPGEPGYEESRVVTYDVCAANGVGDGVVWQPFYNLRWGMASGGTIQDYARMRLRVAQGWKPGQEGKAFARASRVLFLLENGRSQAGIIIGFAEHPDTAADSKELGYYYEFDYNGVKQNINKDGEFSITFTGAILDPVSNDFITAPAETTGSFLKLDKAGSITLDNVKGEKITLDKTEKGISLVGRKITSQTTEGNWELSTKEKTIIQAGNNAVFNSGKKVYIGAEGSTEPLVLGNKLAIALGEMIDIWLQAPLIGQAGPFPCRLHPAIAQVMRTWKNRHRPKKAPFLSKKGYVE